MEFIHTYFGTDLGASMILLLSILLMETILSVDNAAVLALLVKKLPAHQQPKALEYGIWGAFIMRGLSIFLVSILAQLWWLKIAGGLYLMYLTYSHFTTPTQEEEEIEADSSAIFRFFSKYVGVFWGTVAVVEAMDMVFSLDNIFAVTAMTDYVGLIIVAVFIGIATMRFVSIQFIKLMKIMPWLETVAFIVIGILGLKLALTLFEHWLFADTAIMKYLASEAADHLVSYISLAVFALPVLGSLLFNYPARLRPDEIATEEGKVII